MSDLILIADDDRDIVRFVEVNLKLEGFRVATAHDGDDALAKALSLSPSLILLDVMMPRMDGYEVCTKLRADSRSAQIPVIMLTARSLSADKVLGLTAGADDYVIKPFDPMDLVDRVKSTLDRVRQTRPLSPLTGLPGTPRLDEEVQRRRAAGTPLAVVSTDLDNFASFNESYGFLRGDDVILLAAEVLQQAVEETAGKDGLVGHLGADDFVVVMPPDEAERFARRVVQVFDERIPALYDPEDAAAGWIEVKAPGGRQARFPLVSVSLGVAVDEPGRYADYRALLAAATARKEEAKRAGGSGYQGDTSV